MSFMPFISSACGEVLLFFPDVSGNFPTVFRYEENDERVDGELKDEEQEADEIHRDVLNDLVRVHDELSDRLFPRILDVLTVNELALVHADFEIRIQGAVELLLLSTSEPLKLCVDVEALLRQPFDENKSAV